METDTVRVGSEPTSDVKFTRDFQVERITGDFVRTIMSIEETPSSRIINGIERVSVVRKLTPVRDEFHDAFMIYYPQGHSIFVAADDIAQLMQLGVILNSDEGFDNASEVPDTFSALSPKEAVLKAERKRGRSTVGGIEAAMRE